MNLEILDEQWMVPPDTPSADSATMLIRDNQSYLMEILNQTELIVKKRQPKDTIDGAFSASLKKNYFEAPVLCSLSR
jgi:hypothetical protein